MSSKFICWVVFQKACVFFVMLSYGCRWSFCWCSAPHPLPSVCLSLRWVNLLKRTMKKPAVSVNSIWTRSDRVSSSSIWGRLSHPYMTTGKTIALARWTFVGKVMSLLFNMMSRLVIAFLLRSKRLLISWLQSPSAVILEPKNKVCHCFQCFPICFPWSDGTVCHDLTFLNVEF